MTFSSIEIEDLKVAKNILEHPGLAAKISSIVGSSIDKGFAMLPGRWNVAVNDAARKSIEKALNLALRTMDHSQLKLPSNWRHKLAVGTTGAAGGAFGLPALAIELPVSTTIMLRSIADIARSEGENLLTPEARLACIQVLALGGRSKDDDAAETAYFTTRAAMAKAISDAAAHFAKKAFPIRGPRQSFGSSPRLPLASPSLCLKRWQPRQCLLSEPLAGR